MRNISSIIIVLLLTIFLNAFSVRAAQTDISGPSGSGSFGRTITILPNGNIIIVDTLYDAPGGVTDAGAVYLYDGATLTMISALVGSAAGDQIGSGGITVLTNGSYVVSSPNWDNGIISNAGAATLGSGTSGTAGAVSADNSLVGSSANDQISSEGIIVLTNGNYVVRSKFWDNGAMNDAGAATFGSGTSGTSGAVSAMNSLVGSNTYDYVGNYGITALNNGNYVVRSQLWDNGTIVDAGAVTFGNGASGVSGVISASNSLVGAKMNDAVGTGGIIALINGNYVVNSPNWDSETTADAGAVTFGKGIGGISGVISAGNSLVGSTVNDRVGGGGVVALTNGNYVVSSRNWDNGAIVDAGAITFGSGVGGVSGAVSASNSLVGSSSFDNIGDTVTALANGNYVVRSPSWDNGTISDAGAVTFGKGVGGISGLISTGNSLVGSSANDQVGSSGIIALTNGNYVVCSPEWDGSGINNAGAVTFGNGAGGVSGAISAANSLIGSTAVDQVGSFGVTALNNGNYVVNIPNWDNGAITDAGAATFGNGTSGVSGVISASNSLIGSTANDQVGSGGITALINGSYVVRSSGWDNGGISNVGAVTFGSGAGGATGAVSSMNSLIGSTADDAVGNGVVTALSNGNYVVTSVSWDNGAVVNAGAATFGSGVSGVSGAVSAANSLVGSTANDVVGNSGITALSNGNYVVGNRSWDNPYSAVANAAAFTFGNGTSGTTGAITAGASGGNSVVGTVPSGAAGFAFDATRNRLVVGRSASSIVSILSFTTTATSDGDLSSAASFNNGAPNALVTAIIPSGRAMTISSKLNIGLVQVQCGGNLTGGSNAAYIVGSVRKDFCAASNESFIYPLGDANNYSPLTVSNTNGTGALTAAVTDNFLTGLPQAKSLSRYWSLTGAGIIANLTFNYADADVNETEASYRAFKRNSSNLTVSVTSLLDAAANTFTVPGVSQFSDWSAGDAPLAPTAAGVSISGRVALPGNRNLTGATVYMTTADGETVQSNASWKGEYHFDDIAAGQTVVITVFAKRFRFEPRTVNITEDLTEVNFAPLP